MVVTFQAIKHKGKQRTPGEKFVSFHKKVEKDTSVLLRGFKEFRDQSLFFDAKITVSAQKTGEFAASP